MSANPMENPMGKMDNEVLRHKSGVPTEEENALRVLGVLPPGTTKEILARHAGHVGTQKKPEDVSSVGLTSTTRSQDHSEGQHPIKKKKRLYGKMGAANDDSDEE